MITYCEAKPLSTRTMPTESALTAQFLSIEYTSLKQEIYGRSRDQLVCITTSLISIGALLSAVTTDPTRFISLLLIAPWILSIFGIVWCDHHRAIRGISAYLKELEIQVVMNRAAFEQTSFTTPLEGSSDLVFPMTWEVWLNRKKQFGRKGYVRKASRFFGGIDKLLPFFYYLMPSVGALVTYYAVKTQNSVVLPFFLETGILVFDLSLILIFLISWFKASISSDF